MIKRIEKSLENSIFKKGFTKSPVFPLCTAVGKIMTLAATKPKPGLFFGYIALSALIDMGEVTYRECIKNESRENKQGTPYSCFERHIFYDFSKIVIQKLKKQTIY